MDVSEEFIIQDVAVQKRPERFRPTGSACSVEGCDVIAKRRGMCDRHYQHIRQFGKIRFENEEKDGRTTGCKFKANPFEMKSGHVVMYLINKDKIVVGEVLLDFEDFETLRHQRWCLDAYGYARGRKGILMHRVIMKETPSPMYDHKNLNKLDNRRDNLRPCSNSENGYNTGLSSRNKTGAKGIHWTEKLQKWRVLIRKDNKTKHVGYFTEKEDAIKAYDEAAKVLHKEFARLNSELIQTEL